MNVSAATSLKAKEPASSQYTPATSGTSFLAQATAPARGELSQAAKDFLYLFDVNEQRATSAQQTTTSVGGQREYRENFETRFANYRLTIY